MATAIKKEELRNSDSFTAPSKLKMDGGNNRPLKTDTPHKYFFGGIVREAWLILQKMAEILQSPVEFVQQMFKDEEDPTDAITNIQKENRVKVTSLQPAFFLMDLHDLTRREIHLSILQTLKEMLISKLEILEPRAMKRLLDKSFAYVSVPELRSVVMRILETMPRPVNERYKQNNNYYYDYYDYYYYYCCRLQVFVRYSREGRSLSGLPHVNQTGYLAAQPWCFR